MVSLDLSKPRLKVKSARGSRSIKRTFFPYSTTATASACAVVVLHVPPAIFVIATTEVMKLSPNGFLLPSALEAERYFQAIV